MTRRDPRVIGPDREGLCLCGSRRRIRSCHGRRDGSWRADPWQPSAVSTVAEGYSHPGCYARSLGGCSTKLSREHYLSASVLEEISSAPTLSGLAFLERGEERVLPVAAISARILCTSHNEQLSELDHEAAKVFRVLRWFENGLKDSVNCPIDDVELVDGPRFEAWMLKALLGMVHAGVLSGTEGPLRRVREGAEQSLLRVLFQGGSWPDGWGLWVHLSTEGHGAPADLGVWAQGVGEEVWAAEFEFGAFVFRLTLGRPHDQTAIHRPGAVVLLKKQVDVQKVLAIGWPDGVGGLPVTTTRVGQMEGWDLSRQPGGI